MNHLHALRPLLAWALCALSVMPVTAAEPTWERCATEGGQCNFSGSATVRYGADGRHVQRQFMGSTPCSNAVFGDPVPGVMKTCELMRPAPVVAAPLGANGRNVTSVAAGQQGQRVAQFSQTGPGQWGEFAVNGQQSFRFDETGRDDWSVYLLDRARNVRLQLDLHRRQIFYADAANPQMRPLYQVLGAAAAPAAPAPQPAPPPQPVPQALGANGRNVTSVMAAQQGRHVAEFRQTGPGRWIEIAANGTVSFNFDETGRDDWSVYLSDPARGVRLQLDLHRRLALYADGGNPQMRALYEIAAASTPPVHVALAPQAPPPQAVHALPPQLPAPPPPQPAPIPAPPPVAAPAPTAPPPLGANGYSATAVVAGQQGRRVATFRQTGPRQWTEQSNSGGSNFSFDETGRDEWSVYLLDRSRGVRLQLDLHRRLVLFADPGRPQMQPLYEVLAAGTPPVPQAPQALPPPAPPQATPPQPAPPQAAAPLPPPRPATAVPVTGRNVHLVVAGQGGQQVAQFRDSGGGQWVEIDRQGKVTHRFAETGRDDWSVYLLDRSRNVRLQLDLHRKQVLYADGANPQMRPLYQVLQVSER